LAKGILRHWGKKTTTQRSQKKSNQNIIEILGVETFDLSKEYPTGEDT